MNRYFGTFKALSAQAVFNQPPAKQVKLDPLAPEPKIDPLPLPPARQNEQAEFHYNIQIHLPATTDISVYNAIFRSLKENLGL